MSNINGVELQNLRHLILSHDTMSCKMSSYAQDAQSPDVKQFFEKSANSAKQEKTQLMQYLN